MIPRACLLAALLFARFLSGQPPVHEGGGPPKKPALHLEVRGDPASGMTLADGWVPPPWIRSPGQPSLVTKGPLWCSACAEAGEIAKDADLPPRPLELAKRPIADILAWWKGEHKLKPLILATEHSVLMLDLPSCSAKTVDQAERTWLEGHFKIKDPLTPHMRAHLYAFRYLRMEARMMDLLCLDRESKVFIAPFPANHLGAKGRSEIYVFPQAAPYQEFGRHFFGSCGHWTSWWFHDKVEACVAALQAESSSDPIFAARFDHQMAHHILMQYRSFYHFIPKWIPEGLGHFFERRHKEHDATLCVMGLMPDWVVKETDWWKVIKEMVSKNEDLPLAELAMIHDDRKQPLQPRYQVQAWSLMTYTLALGKQRFRVFIDAVKTRQPEESLLELQYRAVEAAYGVDLQTFHRAWRKWVMDTKPQRPG